MRFPRVQDESGFGLPLLGAVLISIFIAGVGVTLALTLGDDEDTETAAVDLQDIVDHRGEYFGERVTIKAPIDEVLNQRLFTVSPPEQDFADVLVVLDTPLEGQTSEVASDGDVVRVTGTVHPIDAAELESRLRGVPTNERKPFNDQPAILATAIELTPNQAAGDAETTSSQDVLDNPDRFYGELTTLTERATRIFSDNAFMLQPGLLVLTGLNAGSEVNHGELVRVTGPVRKLDLATIDERVRDRLDEDVMRRFEGEPVVMARSMKYAVPATEQSRGIDEEAIER